MSTIVKWVLGILVIIIIIGVLWHIGIFGGTTTTTPVQQSAAVSNSTTTANSTVVSDSSIDAINASINAQATSIAKALSAAGGTPSATQISAIASTFQGSNTLMANLITGLTARITNARSAGGSLTVEQTEQAQLTDLGHQLSNMTSQVSAATANTATAYPTTAARQQALKQLLVAQTDLKAAQADIATIVKELGVK